MSQEWALQDVVFGLEVWQKGRDLHFVPGAVAFRPVVSHSGRSFADG